MTLRLFRHVRTSNLYFTLTRVFSKLPRMVKHEFENDSFFTGKKNIPSVQWKWKWLITNVFFCIFRFFFNARTLQQRHSDTNLVSYRRENMNFFFFILIIGFFRNVLTGNLVNFPVNQKQYYMHDHCFSAFGSPMLWAASLTFTGSDGLGIERLCKPFSTELIPRIPTDNGSGIRYTV